MTAYLCLTCALPVPYLDLTWIKPGCYLDVTWNPNGLAAGEAMQEKTNNHTEGGRNSKRTCSRTKSRQRMPSHWGSRLRRRASMHGATWRACARQREIPKLNC